MHYLGIGLMLNSFGDILVIAMIGILTAMLSRTRRELHDLKERLGVRDQDAMEKLYSQGWEPLQ
jgi:hypothetical protein